MDHLLPLNIAAWLACAFFVLGGIHVGAKVVDRFTGRAKSTTVQPQPFTVQAAQVPVTEAACAQRHEAIDERLARTERELEEMRIARDEDRAAASQSRQTLYSHVEKFRDSLLAEIRVVDRRVTRIGVGVARLCGKLNITMPSEDSEL